MCLATNKQQEELMQQVDWIGKEKPHAPREQELEGIQTILATLEASEIDTIRKIDSSLLIRHLRAQKGNTVRAIPAIRSTLAFRQNFFGNLSVDSPELRQRIAADVRTGRCYIRGYDRDGRAIAMSKCVPVHFQNDMSTEQYLLWTVEKAARCTRRTSGLEKFICVLYYCNYCSTYESSFGIAKRFVTNLQRHYPEIAYKVYIVDAPVAFRVFYAIVKPFIDLDTRSKVVFCSASDMHSVMETAVEDPDTLEPFLGGTKSVRDFDAEEYLNIPFDKTFDES